MNIIKISPRGYCHGVINAIMIVKRAVKDDSLPRPIYILGAIIHNQHIVNAFSELGVITIEEKGKSRLELLDQIDKGTVIFTAHGVSRDVTKKAKEKGLNCINATCDDVLKIQNKIINYVNEGYTILYVGQPNHPETEGVIGLSKDIHLINKIEDINNIPNAERIYVTNQTTESYYDIKSFHEAIIKRFPNAIIDNDICNATTVRQKALMEVNADITFVIGDRNSSNTAKLAEISSKKNKTYKIESINDIDYEWLKDVKTVAVTSGASTPTMLTNQIIDYLKQFNYNDQKTWKNFQEIKDIDLL